ncbi:hypothetical protein IKG06_02875 [Candidatus Saccharibacteria bacterium]|nr:hypothetical protein [Candidatus Saccharibacteria bacterium]
MFSDLDETFKKTMEGWYKNNIFPIFEQARGVIIPLGKADKLIPEFGYWWATYIKNSVILLELMLIDKYSNQSAFTMRMLMEISADVLFMSQNQSNVDTFREYYVYDPEKIKDSTYQDFVDVADKLILKDDERHKKTTTTDRIKIAFGSEGLKYYKYLCCYTHLNYIGVIKDIDFSIDRNSSMDYRLEFVKYYPDTFMAMIRAAENFSGENDLFDKVDTKKLRTVISDLVSKHSLGIVE